MRTRSGTPTIILIAGENSRFWPLGQRRHKAFYEVGIGKPILRYVLDECAAADISEVVLVCRPETQGITAFLSECFYSFPITIVVQPEPSGMADAVLRGAEAISGDSFFVLDGNQVFFSKVASAMISRAEHTSAAGVLALRATHTPERFGIAALDETSTFVTGIREKPTDLPSPQSKIVATYYLSREVLPFLEVEKNNFAAGFEVALGHYALTQSVSVLSVDDLYEEVTLKYPWGLLHLHVAILKKELLSGKARIHHSASVHPTAIIENGVHIGAHARIMEYAVVKNGCVIGKNAVVGSFSLVRDWSFLGEGVVMGAHSEVVRSILYSGVTLHRNFIGDSIIDRGVHVGAGTVTANRRHDRKAIKSSVKGNMISTRKTSFGVVVGEEAKLGINCSLRPGTKIGACAVIYEGVTVLLDVGERIHMQKDGTTCRP